MILALRHKALLAICSLIGISSCATPKETGPLAESNSDWRAPGVKIEGENWIAVEVVERHSPEAARLAAERGARALLARTAQSRVEQRIEEGFEQTADGRSSQSSSSFEYELRHSTDVQLRRATLRRVEERRVRADRHVAYAEVHIRTQDLFPDSRLRALIQNGSTRQLLALARDFAAGDLELLAERTLQSARDKQDSAEVRLEIGKFYENRLDPAEALRWYQLTLEIANGDDGKLTEAAQERMRALQNQIPDAATIAKRLLDLARGLRAPKRLGVTTTREGTQARVRIELREPDRRVLTTWVDDELWLHWVASNEADGKIESSVELPLEWPPTDEEAPSRPAWIVIWSLPRQHELWRALDAVRDLGLRLDESEPARSRSKFQSILSRIRRLAPPAEVVRMPM